MEENDFSTEKFEKSLFNTFCITSIPKLAWICLNIKRLTLPCLWTENSSLKTSKRTFEKLEKTCETSIFQDGCWVGNNKSGIRYELGQSGKIERKLELPSLILATLYLILVISDLELRSHSRAKHILKHITETISVLLS